MKKSLLLAVALGMGLISPMGIQARENDNTVYFAKQSMEKYTKYDGYTYSLPSGQPKYVLEIKKDTFKLHCFFQSGSPDFYEAVYTIDLDHVSMDGNTLFVKKIYDQNDKDISNDFVSMEFIFSKNKVIMDVERDTSTLVGGASESIQTGAYRFTSTEKEGTSKKTPDELCSMAQSYYEKHYDYFPPEVEYTENFNGTITIHLYEIVDDGGGTYHTATSAWYTVNEYGVGFNEITNEKVDLNA